MSATWIVQNSSTCVASISSFVSHFRSRRDLFNQSPNGATAKLLADDVGEFSEFLQKLKDLENHGQPTLSPNDELAYVQPDTNGMPVYSLIYKTWRCLYLVDGANLICTAIKIENMSNCLRNVEEDRHKWNKLRYR